MEEQRQQYEERLRRSLASKKNRKIYQETIANTRRYDNEGLREFEQRIEAVENGWDWMKRLGIQKTYLNPSR